MTHHYEGLTLRSYIPSVIFKMRVRNESIGGPNPYEWQNVSTWDLFAGKRVLVFSLPGAFTPTCSTYQLPDFDLLYPVFKDLGIEDIYCVSVNDAFVMNAWAKQQNVSNIKMLPDGSQNFTTGMGMLVSKDNLGFGFRSWRYAVIVNNGKIEKWFVEPGMNDEAENDPYGETSPQNILKFLSGKANDNTQPF